MRSKTYLVGLFALSFLNSSSVSAAALPTWYLERLAEQQQQQQSLLQFEENLHQQDQEFQQQQEFLQPSSHVSRNAIHDTLPTLAQGTPDLVVRGVPDPSTTVDSRPPAETLHCESVKSDNEKNQNNGDKSITLSGMSLCLMIGYLTYPLAHLLKHMVYNFYVGIITGLSVITLFWCAAIVRYGDDNLPWKSVVLTYLFAAIVALALRGIGYVRTWMNKDAARYDDFSIPWVVTIRFRFNSQPFVLKIGNAISESGSVTDVSV